MECQELVVASEAAELSGTLSLPAPDGVFPAVVVAHGAQAGSRNYFLYRHLARLLGTSGIATFAFDRRGEGASTGEPDASFHQLGRDVSAVVRTLASHPRVDSSRLALWGFSQGGWITVLATTTAPPVAALAIVSGTPLTPARQMTHAVTEILRRRGYDRSIIERALRLRASVERYAKGELPIESVGPLVDAARSERWFDDAWIPDLEAVDWSDMDLDITPLIRELQLPTLVLFGELDPWIPVAESIAVWEAVGPPDLSIEVFPDVGHEMIPGDPLLIPADGQPTRHYEQTLLAWMRRVLVAS